MLEVFVAEVVPLPQERGLFRTDCAGGTTSSGALN
jgi:hypothetical protein